jgi:hypothetical protein
LTRNLSSHPLRLLAHTHGRAHARECTHASACAARSSLACACDVCAQTGSSARVSTYVSAALRVGYQKQQSPRLALSRHLRGQSSVARFCWMPSQGARLAQPSNPQRRDPFAGSQWRWCPRAISCCKRSAWHVYVSAAPCTSSAAAERESECERACRSESESDCDCERERELLPAGRAANE